MLTETAYNSEGVLADFSDEGLTWAKNAEAGKTVEGMYILLFEPHCHLREFIGYSATHR